MSNRIRKLGKQKVDELCLDLESSECNEAELIEKYGLKMEVKDFLKEIPLKYVDKNCEYCQSQMVARIRKLSGDKNICFCKSCGHEVNLDGKCTCWNCLMKKKEESINLLAPDINDVNPVELDCYSLSFNLIVKLYIAMKRNNAEITVIENWTCVSFPLFFEFTEKEKSLLLEKKVAIIDRKRLVDKDCSFSEDYSICSINMESAKFLFCLRIFMTEASFLMMII